MKKVNGEGRMSSLNINKRGINMKKTLIVLLTAVLALSMLFVSCSNEAKIDEKVSVSFGVSQSRSLSSSASFAEFSDFDWWYKASTSSPDFNFGKTTGWTKLSNGLSTELEFSQGIWNFELCAVEKNTTAIIENQESGNTVKAYYGSRTGVLIEKACNGNAVTIAISVTPGSTGNGTIVISKDIIVNKRNRETSTIVANNYEIKVKDSDTVSYYGTISNEDVSQIVAAGNYTVTIYYKEEYTGATGGYILRATEPIDVTVYDSSTIRIEGSIDEATQAIIINPINTYKVEASTTATKTGGEFQNVAVTAPMTPAMSSSASDNTIVTVPAAIISAKAGEEATSATVKVAVEVTPVTEASVNDAFKISSGNTAAAAIDLTLYVNDTAVTDYSEAKDAPLLTVETYVAKNLSDVKVSYDGEELAEGTYTYDSNTGYLRFSTKHFSTFVVETSSEAMIGDIAYDTLNAAIAAAESADTIRLIKDVQTASQYYISKNINLDLNGKQVSYGGATMLASGVFYISSGGDLTVYGNGSVNPDGNAYAAFLVFGNGESNPAAKLRIDNGTYKGYYYPISGNGTCHNTEITINGGSFSSVEGLCIYHPQNGTLTINGGSFEGQESAIEIRSGNLVINEGNFTSTASSFSCDPNGSGTTTVGAAIAVAQHTTKKNISVTINDGTFNGVKALNESNPQNNDPAPQVTLNVSGGTFNGEVSAIDALKFITGGTFSSDPSAYVADGYNVIEENGRYVVYAGTIVCTAAELQAILTEYTSSGAGDNVVSIANDLRLADGETWTPARVQGYTGAGVITVNGNGHTIYGLNAPLFAGGFAGNSGIIVNDLTIDDATIDGTHADQGLGGFICSVDSMPTIKLINCHLKNSTITSTGDVRVGGLIGWTAGYNNPNDGPVDTYITVTNCSVENCNITANGSVGAIIGHAGNNPATYHTITGCTVTGTTLNSIDDGGWRVGVVVGTANVGQVTITGTTESGNTLTQTGKTAPEHSNLYGRLVPGDTGKLTIDGVEITE